MVLYDIPICMKNPLEEGRSDWPGLAWPGGASLELREKAPLSPPLTLGLAWPWAI